ncbi:MAG: DUF5678 domain-containing protein [Nostoc sp. DedQUE08]|uniref:DUF5678 domain-containing protein n=1 Tax=unclassified Nostoc TaxID=2593658 RepID=UPI002AD5B40D|nr:MULTISPECIES: DUF5678 domain-containing protein [unclassified Nostoc]MDZ8066599.1 DUF5678 domain-containing protein [Nostoc sp. DedQUE08]MDZ8132301.1 DUF5678 domain-containing protein [Nostoc sp. DedQUE07]
MNTTPTKRETDEMFKWLNRNRQMLLDLYKNQYIAYNANGIIAHSENLREVLALGNVSKQPFLIYLVPRRTASIEMNFTNSLPPNNAVEELNNPKTPCGETLLPGLVLDLS